ncbi:hypothetical protein D3C76_1373930 [compost metagenome]
MLVLGRRQADLDQAQVAGHAQMADQGANLGIEQQVLGTPLDLDETLPGQANVEVLGDRPAQAPVAHDHPADPLAFQVRRNTAPGGFDFW